MYSYTKREIRPVAYIGDLPSDGVWTMTLVPVTAVRDMLVLADRTGKHAPRLIKDGLLTILCAEQTPAMVARVRRATA